VTPLDPSDPLDSAPLALRDGTAAGAISFAPAARSRIGARTASALAGATATALLVAPALWNRFPLLQYDTGGYLARWYEGTLVPSRPGAYGLMLVASSGLDFWPLVLAQAGMTVWMLALVLRVHGFARRPALLLGLTALLTFATTLPWLTSILLTDIFAGLAVLALHLLAVRNAALRRGERVALTVLVAVAASTHSATLALLLALTLAAAAASFWWRTAVPRAGAARAAVAVALGIALTFTANFAVSGRFAWTPGGIALSFGRMLQDGIVARYLDDHCRRDPRLRLCLYRKELPHDADEWFWGSDLFDRLGRFKGLGQEMETVTLGALREYPWLQIKTAAIATARQFVSVASGEGVVNWIWHSYAIIDKYTPGAAPAMRAARQQVHGIDFAPINAVHLPIAYGAMLLLPVIVLLGARRRRYAEFGALAATIVIALLANAAVCGIFSIPHDRYGARVVWLAVLVVGITAIRLGDRKAARRSTPPTAPIRAWPDRDRQSSADTCDRPVAAASCGSSACRATALPAPD
jgi:hypothetical protein